MKITDIVTEAANPAQQAAIAISMKKAGKKPKSEGIRSPNEIGGSNSMRQKLGNIIKQAVQNDETAYNASVLYQKLWNMYGGDINAIIDERSIFELEKLARELVAVSKQGVAEGDGETLQQQKVRSAISNGLAKSSQMGKAEYQSQPTNSTYFDNAGYASDKLTGIDSIDPDGTVVISIGDTRAADWVKKLAALGGMPGIKTREVQPKLAPGMAEDTELAEEFDLIESIVEMIAEHNGVDADVVWADLESLTEDELYVFAVTSEPIMESQGVAEDSDEAVSFREMVNVVDEHYPKYYAELSGSDISDKQFERAIVNAYKKIIQKQGVTEDWQKANKRDKTDGMSQKAVNAYRRENPGSKLKTAVTTKPGKLKKGGKASKRRKSYCSRSRGQMKMHSISCAKTPDKAICKARRRWNC